MYEKIYSNSANLIGIKLDNKSIPIDANNTDYKKYLTDVEDGSDVIDNKPTAQQIANNIKKSNAISLLNNLDKKLPRGLEDIYNALKSKGILLDEEMNEEFLENITLKNNARNDIK